MKVATEKTFGIFRICYSLSIIWALLFPKVYYFVLTLVTFYVIHCINFVNQLNLWINYKNVIANHWDFFFCKKDMQTKFFFQLAFIPISNVLKFIAVVNINWNIITKAHERFASIIVTWNGGIYYHKKVRVATTS